MRKRSHEHNESSDDATHPTIGNDYEKPRNLDLRRLVATASLSTVASAGSYYNDGYGDDYGSYRHHDYDSEYCHWKKVRWYDDYGYAHWKRVKICN